MSEQIVIPSWAISIVIALFMLLIAVARWGVKYLADRTEADIKALAADIKGLAADFKATASFFQQEIGDLRDRVTRLETLVEPGSGGAEPGTNPRARRGQRHNTPPPIGGG